MPRVLRVGTAVAIVPLLILLVGCDSNSVRRPLRRSAQYRTAVAEYARATVVPSDMHEDPPQRSWNQPLPADSPVKAVVSGRAHMDIIKVSYPDDAEPRLVSPLADYTNNKEVRVSGSKLYVYRAVTLFWTEYRLAIYDLIERKLQVDLLVAPEDLPR